MNSITDNQLNTLMQFLGYGNPHRSIWFMGMEEGGGGKENLLSRLYFENIEDCERAHRILGINKYHGNNPKIQPTWRGICIIMLLLNNLPTDREHIRNYQANYLGRFNESSFLCELMPIPKSNVNEWTYNSLIPQYTSRTDYYEKVIPLRINLFQKSIIKFRPKCVICYGKGFWPHYEAIFFTHNFTDYDQFRFSIINGTKVILSHHFTSKTMNHRYEVLFSLLNK